jgi:WASH complex subunit 7
VQVWDAFSDVVAVRYEAIEHCECFELVRTDNSIIGKVLMALGAVSSECRLLKKHAEDNFYRPLSCFGERFDDGPVPEGDESTNIAAILPLLEDLADYVKRCHAVVANGIEQLAGLYSEKSKYFRQTFKGVHMHSFLTDLGELLRCLITLDSIIASNSELEAQWAEYKRMLQSAALEPEIFGMNPKRIGKLLMAVMRLETELFGGAIFRECVMQPFAWRGDDGKDAEARSNKCFVEEVLGSLRAQLAYLTTHIAAPTESNHRNLLVGFVGVYVLINTLNRGRDLDAKLYKAVLALRAKTPVVPLYGRATWSLSDFVVSRMCMFVACVHMASICVCVCVCIYIYIYIYIYICIYVGTHVLIIHRHT